jgi:hypothetical protein
MVRMMGILEGALTSSRDHGDKGGERVDVKDQAESSDSSVLWTVIVPLLLNHHSWHRTDVMLAQSTRNLARSAAHSSTFLARSSSTSSRLPFPIPSQATLDDKYLNNSIILPLHLHPFVFRDLLAQGWTIRPKVEQSEHSFVLERELSSDKYPLSNDQLEELLSRCREVSTQHKVRMILRTRLSFASTDADVKPLPPFFPFSFQHHTDEPLPSTLSLPFTISIITHRTRYPTSMAPGSHLDPDRSPRPPQGLTLRDLHLAQAYEHALEKTLSNDD